MIFDYLDENNAIANAMFRRRLARYRELAYHVELPPDAACMWFDRTPDEARSLT